MGIENVQTFKRDPYGLPPLYSDRARDEPERHPLDAPEFLEVHRDLMNWYTSERTKQSVNRYQQAIDQDFYDGLQWDPDDVEALRDRGQWPLVFNLIKPVVDWIGGTQKRTTLDWKILPRNASGAEMAEVKTALMKYLSDVNNEPWAISAAFKDAVVAGVGWLECGVRGDQTDEPIYATYESWRNVLYDSSSKERDFNDARYLFRWKWIDKDIAEAMFPDRKDIIAQAVIKSTNLVTGGLDENGDEFWYLGQVIGQGDPSKSLTFDRRSYISDTTYVNYRRPRCRLIEGWYRVPVTKQVMRGGETRLHGEFFDEQDPEHVDAVREGVVSLYDTMTLEMRCAVFTDKALLWAGKSPYKHNKFPMTPIWCFRRGRDNVPYGVIRQLRDPQEDYNKRASKALWQLSTNRVVMEEGAVSDIEELRQEVARPDSIVVKRRGSELEIRSDASLAEGQVMLMDRDHMHIQSSSGVTDELMGRKTNAVSGVAIEARQAQGSVTTADIFDNLRYAKQLHGQKMMSLCEQYVSEPRVIRLTGAKGQLEWLQVNQPEVQDDGSVRFLNDITEEQADFVVSEQDYHATTRASMFESLMDLVKNLPPEVALKLIPQILELSDIPNKDEFIAELRQILGLPKPGEQMSEEEQAAAQQQAQQAQQAQQQAQEIAGKMARAELEEKTAGAELKQAQAEKARTEAEMTREGGEDALRMLTQQVTHLAQLLEGRHTAIMQEATPDARRWPPPESGGQGLQEQQQEQQQQPASAGFFRPNENGNGGQV